MYSNRLFSIPGSFAIVAALCVALSIGYQESVFGTLLWVSLSWFCYGKLALAMFFMHGYGVRRMRIVAGMPIVLVVIFAVMAFFICGFFILSQMYGPSLAKAAAGLQTFGWVVSIGVTVAFLHWYFYARAAYFHEMEYTVRCACAARGASPRVTRATLVRCRREGIVAT